VEPWELERLRETLILTDTCSEDPPRSRARNP